MPLDLSPELEALKARTRAFVRDLVAPLEEHDRAPGHGPTEELRRTLQAAAREAGVFAPHVARELGGLGLDVRGQAVIFEEAGRSLLGPLALNCAAPDEGNMAMLERIADPVQRERWLAPLAAGRVRSCFAMTERAPGAGSDPSMLRTEARPVDGGWVLDGEKWFITGGVGAAFAIVMARTEGGATMFLVDAGTEGFVVEEAIETIDRVSPGGHARIRLEDCFVPAEAVLGEPGQGFRYAQVRLAPARLTHCMRWLGLARRSLDVALARRPAARELGVARRAEIAPVRGAGGIGGERTTGTADVGHGVARLPGRSLRRVSRGYPSTRAHSPVRWRAHACFGPRLAGSTTPSAPRPPQRPAVRPGPRRAPARRPSPPAARWTSGGSRSSRRRSGTAGPPRGSGPGAPP